MPIGLRNWRFKDIEKFLIQHNFSLKHVEGSHHFFVGVYKNELRQVCVPFHSSKIISFKTMKGIIRQSGIPKNLWKV